MLKMSLVQVETDPQSIYPKDHKVTRSSQMDSDNLNFPPIILVETLDFPLVYSGQNVLVD